MATLPYVTAVGNIEKALKGIKAAATPEAVSQDFVKTILGIKGGSGNQMTAYLKKLVSQQQMGRQQLYIKNLEILLLKDGRQPKP